jgi:hypothetical protein
MFEIRCNGEMLNPCRGMTEGEARAAFQMYSGPQASKDKTYTLHQNGVEIERREVKKK